jgi:hypothetical protein
MEASEYVKNLLGKNEHNNNLELSRILAAASLKTMRSVVDSWGSILKTRTPNDVSSNWEIAIDAVNDILNISGSKKLLNDSLELLMMIAARENDPVFSDLVSSIGVMVYLATNPTGSFVTYSDMVYRSEIDYRKTLTMATIKDKAKDLNQ